MAVTTVRADALATSTDLAQAGAVFNDATRLLDGGLWDTPADSNNQIAYLGMYTTDIHSVLNDVTSMLANPGGVTVGGAALNLASADTAVLTQVQGQLETLLTLANGSVGNSATAATNQELIHTTQTSILNEINGDTTLANALAATGATYMGGTGATNVGFEALPTGADDAASLAAASGANATLAQIGNVFNAATDLAVGGLNTTNLGQFNTDMQAIATGLTNLINNPTALAAIEKGEAPADAALTTVHLDTVLDQINLQINNFDAAYATNPNVAARSTNDNLLDIIDIVQGDTALNTAAGGNGNAGTVGGFAEMPAYLEGTITKFQDDQAQTNFWAKFLSEANVINNQLTNVAAGNNTTPGELNALITEIQNYQSFGAAFDHSQGGIFGARFDNELLGGTLNADTANAVHGLQGILAGDTGAALAADQAQITAAGQGFAADANDVSGNNIPLGGGTYVGTSTTVAGATSVPGVAQGTIPVDGTATGSSGTSGGSGNSGSQVAGGQGTGDTGSNGSQGANGQTGGNGGQDAGGQGSGGKTAQGGGDNGGQDDGCHGCGGNSGEHGNHGGQPVPSFWNFVENEHGHEGFGGRGHNQFELMWHHA
jgi:trimeric autotransporter adhesin